MVLMLSYSQIVELTYSTILRIFLLLFNGKNDPCIMFLTPQVVQRIKAVDHETRLLVVDQETHEKLRSLRLTATEDMAVLGTGPHPSPSPPASPSPSPSSVPPSPSKKRENGSVSKQPVTASPQVQKQTKRSPSKAAKKVSWPSIEAVRGFTCNMS